MRQAGIQGVLRSKRVRTTRPGPGAGRHPDLVKRQFTASEPNELWVTDLTFVATWAGVAYVCFIVDAFSRMIVGWRVAGHMRTPMVLDAIEMARWNRGLHHDGLRCHSTPGRNSRRFATANGSPRSARSRRSGRSATAIDNALAETVNGYYKAELIRGPARTGPWKTVEEVELATLGWVHWHNTQRLHGYLDDLPPAEFEALHAARGALQGADPGDPSVSGAARRAAERLPARQPDPSTAESARTCIQPHRSPSSLPFMRRPQLEGRSTEMRDGSIKNINTKGASTLPSGRPKRRPVTKRQGLHQTQGDSAMLRPRVEMPDFEPSISSPRTRNATPPTTRRSTNNPGADSATEGGAAWAMHAVAIDDAGCARATRLTGIDCFQRLTERIDKDGLLFLWRVGAPRSPLESRGVAVV